MTLGPQHLPTEWVARLASLVHELRPDWDEHGVRSVLSKVADRPLIDVASAAVAACRRIDQRTPSIIAASGSHWPDASNSQRTYTEPGIVTYCAHGEPGMRCTECYPRHHQGAGPTDEQRAAMRAAIDEAKQITKERERR